MKTKNTDLLREDKVFIWIALATGLILLIPVVGMQISTGWNWDSTDFMIIGALLFGTGSLFVLVARKVQNTKHRIILGLAFFAALLYIWAELAVGIFTNWGS